MLEGGSPLQCRPEVDPLHRLETAHSGASLRQAEWWIETRFSPRTLILVTCGLLLAQAGVLWRFGGQSLAGLLSNLVQVLLGLICLLSSLQAFRRSGTAGRHYWRWLAAAFTIWVVAQGLGTYLDAFPLKSGNDAFQHLDDFLFFCALLPFGMLLFLDTDHEHDQFDRLHILDFLQVCAFWGSAYLFFPGGSVAAAATGWGWFGWTPSIVIDGVLGTSFLLRAVLTNSAVVRAFFGRMALFIVCSGLADSYASYAPNQVVGGGHWFDLVWSVLVAIPLLIAATWNQAEAVPVAPPTRAHNIVVRQFFPLLFPFFSLLLLAQVAVTRTDLASCLMILSFAGVGVRVLIIQHRLVRAQAALEFESAHDALTGLWNRVAILEFLEKEIERQKRTGEPLGVMMVDVDHFKTVNDTRGHLAGDMVLREVAKRLAASVRGYNFVGRYGGEEFLIMSQNCDGPGVLTIAERLRQAVYESPMGTAKNPISVTVSVGAVSTTAKDALGIDHLMILRAADHALYAAKSAGRNCVRSAEAVVEPELTAELAGKDFQKLSAHSSG
jgi:diguanylate cyclase (GGDEF)-like protein